MSSALLVEWENQQTSRWRRRLGELWTATRRPALGLALCSIGFVAGFRVAARANGPFIDAEVQDRIEEAQLALEQRESELELVRLELARLNTIVENSARYGISADLAAAIHDIALAEGVDPSIAYRLVRVESGFTRNAVSHKGAVGLTQVMPRTAFGLAPELDYSDLFERDTNLHLGFRYLRMMLERYNGDLRLALLAYNRGPGTVDNIRREGGDPANGYAQAVLGGQ